jgi:hypothetical protein
MLLCGPSWLPNPPTVQTPGDTGSSIYWIQAGFRRKARKPAKRRKRSSRKSGTLSSEERRELWAAMIDGEAIKTRADLARHLGVSRARVTQVLGPMRDG